MNAGVRCIVLTGNEKAFAAGADISEFESTFSTTAESLKANAEIRAAVNAIAACPFPTLALIDGPASARMAVGEALTNLAAAPVADGVGAVPSMLSVPASGRAYPATRRASVLLPQPDTPMSTVSSPGSMWNEQSSSTCTGGCDARS